MLSFTGAGRPCSRRAVVIVRTLMNVAIVAPWPSPYIVGGTENLCRWLEDYINDYAEHQAETFKLPTRDCSAPWSGR
jgi:hypothetical protein